MTNSRTRIGRTARLLTASAAAIATAVVAVPAPAWAAAAFIDRAGCRWHAESYTYEADTNRVDPDDDCAGHAYVQIKAGGSWSGWEHDYHWAHMYAPSGRPIQQSRHKSCSDCGYITLTP